jgi:hypothetical protein
VTIQRYYLSNNQSELENDTTRKCLLLDANPASAHEGIPVFCLQPASLLAWLQVRHRSLNQKRPVPVRTAPWTKRVQSVSVLFLKPNNSSTCPHRSLNQKRPVRVRTVPWIKRVQSVSVLFLEPNNSSPCPHNMFLDVFLYHTPPNIVPIKCINQNIITSVLELLTGINTLLTALHTLLTALHILFTPVSVLSTTSEYYSQLCVCCWCVWFIVYNFRGISDSSSCISDSYFYMRISDSCSAFLTAVVHCWQL